MKRHDLTLVVFLLFSVCLFAQIRSEDHRLLRGKTGNARIRTLNQLSWDLHYSDPRQSLRYGKMAIRESRQNAYWEGLAYANKHTGAAFCVIGNYDSARVYLDRSLNQFTELGNPTQTGNLHNLIGLLFWETGQPDSALVAYNRAFEAFERTGDSEGKAIVYSNRGIIYYETGHYARALASYNRSLRISTQLKDSNVLSSTHTNIGIIYSVTGNYRKAIAHHRKAYLVDNPKLNPSGCAKYLTNIGTCYFHLHQLDSSLFYHRKALHLYQNIGEQKGIAHALLNIGSIYQEQHHFSRAESHFLRGLQLKQTMGDETGKVIAHCFLGGLYLENKRFKTAERHLLSAYEGATRLKSVYYQTEISLLLAELYEKTDQPDLANHYFRQYAAANNRLLHEKSDHRLVELQIGLATHEKQQLIRRLKHRQQHDKWQFYTLLAASFGMLVIAVLVVRYLRRRHTTQQQQLRKELEDSRIALNQLTRTWIEQHPVTVETGNTSEERMKIVQQLGQSRLITENDWETFKRLFEKVNPAFMLRLKQQIPEITPGELRLASLLLLQLSTREIAAILGISPESVKKARQRLRKKLKLDAETELETYLAGFSG